MKKTAISFGLVNIPVTINPIIKNNDIAFHQLHKKCLTRIKYVKYCPHCKKNVKQSDIIRGYEVQDDDYITLSDEEFSKLKSEDEKIIEIIGFIDLKDIDSYYFEKSYVVTTNTKSKAYSLFKEAILKAKKVALAKSVIGTKFYYVILRVIKDILIMDTLYFYEEVNIPEVEVKNNFTKKELDLALELIKSLEMKFNPQDLKDEYYDKIKQALDNKAKGKKINKSNKKQQKNIKDLMTALEMSLKNVS